MNPASLVYKQRATHERGARLPTVVVLLALAVGLLVATAITAGRGTPAITSVGIIIIAGSLLLEVRVGLELKVDGSVTLRLVGLEEVRNLLFGLEQGASQDRGERFITVAVERAGDSLVANTSGAT